MNHTEKLISEMSEIVQSSPCLAVPLACGFVSAFYHVCLAEARKSASLAEEDCS